MPNDEIIQILNEFAMLYATPNFEDKVIKSESFPSLSDRIDQMMKKQLEAEYEKGYNAGCKGGIEDADGSLFP